MGMVIYNWLKKCSCILLSCLCCAHCLAQDISSTRFFKFNFNTLSSPSSILSNIPSAVAPPADFEPSQLIEAELRFPIKLKGKTKLIGSLGYQREMLSGLYLEYEADEDDIDLVPLHNPSLSFAVMHSFNRRVKLINNFSVQSRSNDFLSFRLPAMAFRNTFLLEKSVNQNKMGIGMSIGVAGNRFSIIPILEYQKELSNHWQLDLLLPAKALLTKAINRKSRLLFGARGNTAEYFFDQAWSNGFTDLSYRRLNVNLITGYERQLTPIIGIGVEGGVTVPLRSGLYRNDQRWQQVHNFGTSVAPYFNMKFFLSLPK